MKKNVVTPLALLALTCWVASAADIDGKWTRTNAGRNGGTPTTQTLTLKSDGTNLTGTLAAGTGDPVNITEGKITGNMVTFKATRNRNGKETTQTYTGTVSATELKLTVSGGGGGRRGGGGNQEQVWTKAAS